MIKDMGAYLEEKYELYNTPSFVENDPICIPYQYSSLQDVEITAFWTSVLAWGLRKTIINKATELFELMDNAPYDFLVNHEEKDREKFLQFKHRTFQPDDTLYFLEFFQQFYKEHDSLEDAFLIDGQFNEASLTAFKSKFFQYEHLRRTEKHIPSPKTGSTCKRLSMFLRWMVRKDDSGVDLGVWNQINTADLYIPLDVHVDRVGRKLGLIDRKQRDWKTVVELTDKLKQYDPVDPIKYDLAIFGIGLYEKEFVFS